MFLEMEQPKFYPIGKINVPDFLNRKNSDKEKEVRALSGREFRRAVPFREKSAAQFRLF